MKTIARMALQPGMILGQDVLDYQGNIIFRADTTVDYNIIDRLTRYSVMCVVVKEDVDFASTHYEKIRFNENFKAFEALHMQSLKTYKKWMTSFLQTGRKIEDRLLLQLVYDLRELAPTGACLLDYIYNMMPNEDELTYTHCLNAALLSSAFAEWLSMNEEARNTLVLCGFYYDIGKLMLPYELLWKPGKLTEDEFETIKTHPFIGYSVISNLNLNQHVKNAAIMHHERLDGSGYPYHLTGDKIDLYARYIAIADAYVAMASPRSYRNSLAPLQVLGNFEKSMEKYDIELLLPLMKRISDAQIGSRVQLNDGTVWEVFIIHPNKFSRPILRNAQSQILDLLQYPDLEIAKMI